MSLTHPSSPSDLPPPTVCVLVDERYLHQAQPAGAVAALRRHGWEVRQVVVEQTTRDLQRTDWLAGVDVVLPRGRSSALVGLLRTAELAGVRTVISAAALDAVRNKASMASALARLRVPAPCSWLGAPGELARREDLSFPLILKPVTGDNARGLVVVRDRRELARLSWPDVVALAQPFHRGDGHDLKLYVVGREVWGVRRPSPIHRDGSRRQVLSLGEQVELPSALIAMAQRCAAAFGLPLAGIDVVGTPGRGLVVEVNEFPTYRGVLAEADEHIARLVSTMVGARAVPAGQS